ncbi:MAG: PQQ-binding-like beta-propeller repeat protein [bacterium]
MRDHRYQGGLWAALFIILLLPFLFLDAGSGNPRLARPVLGLRSTWPRAQEVWQYFGQAGELTCWLGGPLTKSQLLAGDDSDKVVAIASDGSVLWTEESSASFKAVSDGCQLLLATDKGQVSSFEAKQGIQWSESSKWPVQALAVGCEGRAAVAQGPMVEGDANLLERVRLYEAGGGLISEHLLRNSSALTLIPGTNGWFLSTVMLVQDQPQGQLLQLTPGKPEAKALWRSPDIIQAFAVGTHSIAAAVGNKVYIVSTSGEVSDFELKGQVPDVVWVDNETLAVVEAGDSPLAVAYITLASTGGNKLWRKGLKGPCRSLAVRDEEILVADPNIVYSFSLEGDVNWCYESSTPLQGIFPLADRKEVVVTTVGNHLILLEPPNQ